jgi:hypothetical protein
VRVAEHSIVFRDITGADLEFLDCFLDNPDGSELSYENIVTVLQYLVVNRVSLRQIWSREVNKLWRLVSENILCRYMNKKAFLKLAGVLQNGRFITLLEEVPMTKLILMADVYQEIVQEQSEGS